MDPVQAVILGVLQGATEFLPISSSAHLVLAPWLLGWDSPGLLFDTMVHWGTLAAVLLYFWRDILRLIVAGLRALGQRSLADPDARIAWGIVLGTLPAVTLGLLFEDLFEALFLNPRAVSAFLLITALLLFLAERVGQRRRALPELSLVDAILIGLGQAIAIAPGVSRSGATIAAGLARGLRREAAARFSFLLSVPAIVGAGALQLVRAASGEGGGTPLLTLLLGFAAAAVAGYVCIRFLLRYLQRGSLYGFVVYCAAAGLAGLALSFLRG